MVPGFNSEIQHRGRRYHIQTEDLGVENPCLLTLVYEAGAILTRIKVPYAEVLGPQASTEQIRAFSWRRATVRSSRTCWPIGSRPGRPRPGPLRT